MAVALTEKENARKRRNYFSHKQVVTTAATVVSVREPKAYSTMSHFRKKWISFKGDFHSDVDKPTKTHWKIWRKRATTPAPPPPPPPQALFNLNLPIVISSTHNYYGNKQTEEERKHHYLQSKDEPQKAQSIVQQLTIIPSFNANLFLIVVLVALLVITFGILQIHRTISILNTGIDLIRHTLTTSVFITKAMMTSIMSFFF